MVNDGSEWEGDVEEDKLYQLLEAIFPEGEEGQGRRDSGIFYLDLPEEIINDLLRLGFIEVEDQDRDVQPDQNRYTVTPKGLRFLECIDKMNQLLSNSGNPK